MVKQKIIVFLIEVISFAGISLALYSFIKKEPVSLLMIMQWLLSGVIFISLFTAYNKRKTKRKEKKV